jgi:DNA-binding NarL/FixJ family response regulator
VENHVLALIAAKPGRVRDGLRALLATMPRIHAICLADDGLMALDIVAQKRPRIVLLDTNLPHNSKMWGVLEQIKDRWPHSLCLVLADNDLQKQAAQVAGADGVLIKGFATSELFIAIRKLLQLQPQPVWNGVDERRELQLLVEA